MYVESGGIYNTKTLPLTPIGSGFAMALIDGKTIAQTVRSDIAAAITQLKDKYPNFQPRLVIIQVAERKDSTTYVNMKKKAAAEAGIICDVISLPETVAESTLLGEISTLNSDHSVHGILVQLPLPKHISEPVITSAVAPAKDVDGFGPENVGAIASRDGVPTFLPCTPQGILHLLKVSDVTLEGANAVVLGRSDIVGGPVASLLCKENVTVTTVHSKSKNVPELLKTADIVIAAIGQPEYVKGDWLKPGCSVIDVGTNFIDDPSRPKGFRMVGDVAFDEASKVAGLITPVPGGVGPMTVAMLMKNVYIAATRAFEQEQKPGVVKPLPLEPLSPVPSDIEVSRAQVPKDISVLTKEMGLLPHEVELYGSTKAKIQLSVLERLANRPDAKYVLVAGITPTPLGEGKSTTTMGLTQALGAHMHKPSIACVRQPSMGPTFGVKGGAAGGGYSQVIPMEEFNLHLTGDIHAISAATNLLAAALDTRMFHESTQKDGPLYRRLVPTKKGERKFTGLMYKRLQKLGIHKSDPDSLTPEEITRFARLDIDPATITWRRVVDCNDRMLRGVEIGRAPTEKGHTRDTGFDISVASECMAVLTLATSLEDMRERLGRMVVASSKAGDPITADDLGCGGALTALMKDTVKPNVMQTLEGTPVLVHAGPFANISIGANSVLADKVALKLAGAANPEDQGYVITEAGFDFTMGGERFLNIKCRNSGHTPDVVVIVATVRALKSHGGAPPVSPGAPLPDVYLKEDVETLRKGCANLAKHIENARSYGPPVVVAINKMTSDTEAEHNVIREEALKAGAEDAIVSDHWAKGGAGAVDLAKGVMEAAKKPTEFEFLYDVNLEPEEKLEIICQKMYGASGIELSDLAKQQLDRYKRQGFGSLPICVAKTQYSLSADPNLKGRPTGFVVPIRDVRASVGAGYLYALAAEIMTIPGLPTAPGFFNIEVTPDGQIEGMF